MCAHHLGIDPSLSATGIANDADHWTVRTESGQRDRLAVIHDAIVCTVLPGPVTLAAIEDLPTHAHGAGLTGMAQGVVRLALIQHQIPWVKVTAATLKKYATGSGVASKPDMRMAWYQRTNEDVRDDNRVDALWLRQIALALTDAPDVIALPKTHRDALTKVVWP